MQSWNSASIQALAPGRQRDEGCMPGRLALARLLHLHRTGQQMFTLHTIWRSLARFAGRTPSGCTDRFQLFDDSGLATAVVMQAQDEGNTQQQQQQQEQQEQQACVTAADRPQESSPANEEAGTSAADGSSRGFAARRPGWQLPSLHEGLQLDSDEPLTQFKGRQKCPKW